MFWHIIKTLFHWAFLLVLARLVVPERVFTVFTGLIEHVGVVLRVGTLPTGKALLVELGLSRKALGGGNWLNACFRI